jgi:hypothetical protein
MVSVAVRMLLSIKISEKERNEKIELRRDMKLAINMKLKIVLTMPRNPMIARLSKKRDFLRL